MSNRTKVAASILSAALLLSLAACGDDKPDPIPSTSGTPTPTVSVSPAPSEPALTEDEKADYQTALERYDSFRDFAATLAQNPKVDDEAVRNVLEYMTLPGSESFSDSIDQLISTGARVEGRRDRAWITPVKVTSTTVVLRECETPGTWVLVGKDGTRAPQKNNTVTRIGLKKVKGNWYVDSAKGDGQC